MYNSRSHNRHPLQHGQFLRARHTYLPLYIEFNIEFVLLARIVGAVKLPRTSPANHRDLTWSYQALSRDLTGAWQAMSRVGEKKRQNESKRNIKTQCIWSRHPLNCYTK